MSDVIQAAPGVPGTGDVRPPERVIVLPLRETVLFPLSVVPLAAGREASVRAIEEAVRGSRLIGVFAQREAGTEDPGEADLHRVGTLVTVHKVFKQPDGPTHLVVQGLSRIRLLELVQHRPYLEARIEPVAEIPAAHRPGNAGARAQRDRPLREGRGALADASRRAGRPGQGRARARPPG